MREEAVRMSRDDLQDELCRGISEDHLKTQQTIHMQHLMKVWTYLHVGMLLEV